MSTWGGVLVIFFLILYGVSPCLSSTFTPKHLPSLFSLKVMSLFRARSGVMYMADIGSLLLTIISYRTGIIAASVFPEPVGATIMVEILLLYIMLKAFFCKDVNSLYPIASKHLLMSCISLVPIFIIDYFIPLYTDFGNIILGNIL